MVKSYLVPRNISNLFRTVQIACSFRVSKLCLSVTLVGIVYYVCLSQNNIRYTNTPVYERIV